MRLAERHPRINAVRHLKCGADLRPAPALLTHAGSLNRLCLTDAARFAFHAGILRRLGRVTGCRFLPCLGGARTIDQKPIMRPLLPMEQGESDRGHQLAMNWANFVPGSAPAGGIEAAPY